MMTILSQAYDDIAYNDSSGDSLDDILKLQNVLVDLLLVDRAEVDSSALSAGIGMSCEAAEVLDLMNKANRPWKSKEDKDRVKQKILEETIDVLFYALEIFNLFEVDSEQIQRLFVRKFCLNCARIFESYDLANRFQAMALYKKSPESEYFKYPVIMKAIYWLREYGYLTKDDELSDLDMLIMYNPQATVIRMQEGKLL